MRAPQLKNTSLQVGTVPAPEANEVRYIHLLVRGPCIVASSEGERTTDNRIRAQLAGIHSYSSAEDPHAVSIRVSTDNGLGDPIVGIDTRSVYWIKNKEK